MKRKPKKKEKPKEKEQPFNLNTWIKIKEIIHSALEGRKLEKRFKVKELTDKQIREDNEKLLKELSKLCGEISFEKELLEAISFEKESKKLEKLLSKVFEDFVEIVKKGNKKIAEIDIEEKPFDLMTIVENIPCKDNHYHMFERNKNKLEWKCKWCGLTIEVKKKSRK